MKTARPVERSTTAAPEAAALTCGARSACSSLRLSGAPCAAPAAAGVARAAKSDRDGGAGASWHDGPIVRTPLRRVKPDGSIGPRRWDSRPLPSPEGPSHNRPGSRERRRRDHRPGGDPGALERARRRRGRSDAGPPRGHAHRGLRAGARPRGRADPARAAARRGRARGRRRRPFPPERRARVARRPSDAAPTASWRSCARCSGRCTSGRGHGGGSPRRTRRPRRSRCGPRRPRPGCGCRSAASSGCSRCGSSRSSG